jgi:uncharacterized protein YgfB (UPF0149 family)
MRPEVKQIIENMVGKTVDEMNEEFVSMELNLSENEESEVISTLDAMSIFNQ